VWRIPREPNKESPQPECPEDSKADPDTNFEKYSEKESIAIFQGGQLNDQTALVTIVCPNNWCGHSTQVPRQKTAVAVHNIRRHQKTCAARYEAGQVYKHKVRADGKPWGYYGAIDSDDN